MKPGSVVSFNDHFRKNRILIAVETHPHPARSNVNLIAPAAIPNIDAFLSLIFCLPLNSAPKNESALLPEPNARVTAKYRVIGQR